MNDQQISAEARLIAASNLVIADAIMAHTESTHKGVTAMSREEKLRNFLAEALKKVDDAMESK